MSGFLYVSHGRRHDKNTRTDLDAISSVAIFWRGALRKGLRRGADFEIDFIDYYNDGLGELRRHRDASVFVADIPPEAIARNLESTLADLAGRGLRLNFIDHHPVSAETARRFSSAVENGLIDSAILSDLNFDTDRTTPTDQKLCAAEMSLEFLSRRFGMRGDGVSRRIARYAHDQDFGVRMIKEANRLSVVIGANHDPVSLAEMLALGDLWSDELEEIHRNQVARTRRLLRTLSVERRRWKLSNGRELAVVYALLPDEGLKVTSAGIHCLEAHAARVAVLVHPSRFVSMRIVAGETDLHAGAILSAMGGGGHAGAASAGGLSHENTTRENFGDVVDRLDRRLAESAGVASY